jgi:NADH-quinone oxidoreductase subunit C
LTDATTDTPAGDEAPVTDELRQPILDRLTSALGDALLGSELAGGDIWVRVDRGAWRRALELCRSELGLEYFCFLSGLDWQPAPELSGEKVFEPAEGVAPVDNEAEDDTDEPVEEAADVEMPGGPAVQQSGVAGGDTRFQVFARLYSVTDHVGLTIKADLDDERPEVDSVADVYPGADWHERETWEMYGFQFTGHPGLRHLYLPGEFEGFPLRKDFPLLAREVKPWPGIVDVEPLPGEPAGEGDAEAEA